jgi:exodeoxyribonuclease VII small subunit
MAEKKRKDDISKLNFEDSIKQLKDIVERIEQGQIPLQDSLEEYEKGMTLINHCRGILQKAEKRIEKITKDQEGGEPNAAEPEAEVPQEGAEDAEADGLF